MGIERQNHMFFLSFTNLHFNSMNIDYIHVNDCHEVQQQEYDNFDATCGVLNPPYSMSKKNNNAETHSEWAFALRALKNIRKGGKLAVIIPISCGCEENAVNTDFKKRIMENNTLEKIIKINPQAFSTAKTFTQIFVFTAGIPHKENHKVLVADYTEDGYNMQSERGRITGDVDALEERINDICFNNKIIKGLSHFETFTPEKEWVYIPEDDEMFEIREIIKSILNEKENETN
jgi:type I restriction-modification system DNA methylase subunit